MILPKKICYYVGCNAVINFSEKYCEEHKRVKISDTKERYRQYDIKHRDKRAAEFYHSREWIITSNTVINKYNRLDLFAYYIENRIVYANTAHHIIELKDDWDKRLDINNLFPTSPSSHAKIHKLYLKNKKGTQELLLNLIEKYKKGFIDRG